MAASATFALKAGVWFRRGRLLIVSPDSLGTACSLSGRNSTYRPVQISGTGSNQQDRAVARYDREVLFTAARRGECAREPAAVLLLDGQGEWNTAQFRFGWSGC